MKKFIKNILFFLLVLPVVYILCVIVWGEIAPQFLKKNLSYKIIGGYLNTRINEIKNYGDVDILVLGPSGAYRGFDPRIFGKKNIKLFNLGSSSQTPIQTEILINRYLDKLKPKIVLYVVNPDMFGDKGIESTVDLVSSDDIDFDELMIFMKTYNINVYNTIMYTLYKQHLNKDNCSEIASKINDDTYIKGGFVEKSMKVFNDTKTYPSIQVKIIKNQMKSFENILFKLKKQNIKVILIQPPLTKNYYNSFVNKERMNQFFTKLHYKYINLNTTLPFEDKYFYDYGHLNQPGVEKFNKCIIDSLISYKILSI
jgi:poly-D-alanine transfer protein DltD